MAAVAILAVIAVPAVLNDPDPVPVTAENDRDPAPVTSENDPDPAPVTSRDLPTNGWVAFPVDGGDGDHDIYLVGLEREAFRVTGSDSDALDELCPAFSSDGARLAYGQGEGTIDTSYVVASAAGGFGLAGLAERVEAIGGQLTAGPRPAAGFYVRARLPAAAPAEANS